MAEKSCRGFLGSFCQRVALQNQQYGRCSRGRTTGWNSSTVPAHPGAVHLWLDSPRDRDTNIVEMPQPGWWEEESCWGGRGMGMAGGEEASARGSRGCGGVGQLQHGVSPASGSVNQSMSTQDRVNSRTHGQPSQRQERVIAFLGYPTVTFSLLLKIM